MNNESLPTSWEAASSSQQESRLGWRLSSTQEASRSEPALKRRASNGRFDWSSINHIYSKNKPGGHASKIEKNSRWVQVDKELRDLRRYEKLQYSMVGVEKDMKWLKKEMLNAKTDGIVNEITATKEFIQSMFDCKFNEQDERHEGINTRLDNVEGQLDEMMKQLQSLHGASEKIEKIENGKMNSGVWNEGKESDEAASDWLVQQGKQTRNLKDYVRLQLQAMKAGVNDMNEWKYEISSRIQRLDNRVSEVKNQTTEDCIEVSVIKALTRQNVVSSLSKCIAHECLKVGLFWEKDASSVKAIEDVSGDVSGDASGDASGGASGGASGDASEVKSMCTSANGGRLKSDEKLWDTDVWDSGTFSNQRRDGDDDDGQEI